MRERAQPVTDATQLVRYDAMCHAIAAAHEVDEVRDIRDKARAIEMYARQAQNTEGVDRTSRSTQTHPRARPLCRCGGRAIVALPRSWGWFLSVAKYSFTFRERPQQRLDVHVLPASSEGSQKSESLTNEVSC
jgi:hypothetical protein